MDNQYKIKKQLIEWADEISETFGIGTKTVSHLSYGLGYNETLELVQKARDWKSIGYPDLKMGEGVIAGKDGKSIYNLLLEGDAVRLMSAGQRIIDGTWFDAS